MPLVVEVHGGVIERFAGDAVLVIFNADGSLDTTFDGDGVRPMNIDAGNYRTGDVLIEGSKITSVAPGSDGRG